MLVENHPQSKAVPANAWLTGITSTTTADDTMVTIVGTAGSQTLVGQTMTNLGAYPGFDRIDLHFTQMANTPTQKVPTVNFEIGAHLKSTKPPEPRPGTGPEKQAKEGGANGKPSA